MKPRSDYDVVVVGASCAGLVTARDLAQAGLRTLVLDSRPGTEKPSRSWIVTQKIRKVLDCDISASTMHETGVMELVARGARTRVRLAEPDLVVERASLRRILAADAEARGAEIVLGRRVRQLDIDGSPLRVMLNGRGNGKSTALRARHVVGADGVSSLVAGAIRSNGQRSVPILQARVALPVGHDPDITIVWFDRMKTRFFYWLIPESSTTGVLGFIAENPNEARRLLDEFLAEKGFVPLEYQAAMIPLHRPTRRLEWRSGGSRVLLVGDAAGHVKVTTVGGVVSGVWGARAAARALARETPYRRELSGLHRELWLHDLIRWIMDRFDDDHYASLLSLLNNDLSGLLGRHDRDSLAPQTWTLLRAQPRLLPLAIRVLLGPALSSRV